MNLLEEFTLILLYLFFFGVSEYFIDVYKLKDKKLLIYYFIILLFALIGVYIIKTKN